MAGLFQRKLNGESNRAIIIFCRDRTVMRDCNRFRYGQSEAVMTGLRACFIISVKSFKKMLQVFFGNRVAWI